MAVLRRSAHIFVTMICRTRAISNVIRKYSQMSGGEKVVRPLKFLDSSYAVLVLNQPIRLPSPVLKHIWNLANYRVLIDGGADRFLEIFKLGGFSSPSFISGDFDSITATTKDYFVKQNVKLIPTPDQNETDFAKGLTELVNMAQSQGVELSGCVVLSQHCGRLDQLLADLHTMTKWHKKLNLVILNEENVTFVIGAGASAVEVGSFMGQTCGILPLCGQTNIRTLGLVWNLDGNYGFGSGILSSSNQISQPILHIEADKDIILTINPPIQQLFLIEPNEPNEIEKAL